MDTEKLMEEIREANLGYSPRLIVKPARQR